MSPWGVLFVANRELPQTDRLLTAQQALFVVEYASSGNEMQAYKAAYPKQVPRTSVDLLHKKARALLKQPNVARAVEAERRMVEDKLMFNVRDVMQEWFDIATADVNELISVRLQCCRYCHGEGNRYQWTEREYTEACFTAMKDGKEPPDWAGGMGFNFTLDPNPQCPDCFGRGHATTVLHDTTKLSRKAAKMYAGVKHTKYGIEVLTRDPDAALANIAKALGMFAEVVRLEHHLSQQAAKPLPTDPTQAALAYKDLIADE